MKKYHFGLYNSASIREKADSVPTRMFVNASLAISGLETYHQMQDSNVPSVQMDVRPAKVCTVHNILNHSQFNLLIHRL